jgi:hypothetical protein
MPIHTVLMVLVPGIAGAALLGVALYQYLRGERAKSWPTAQGTVTRSGVRQGTSKDSDGDSSVVHYPDVEYTYSAAGQEMSSERIGVGPGHSMSQGAAERIAARYPLGARVTVFYDPAKPDYGVLEAGARPMVVLAFGVGGLFATGLAIFFFTGMVRSL